MKIKMLVALIIFCFVSISVFANTDEQVNDESPDFSLTLYPVPVILVGPWFSAECEVGLTDHFSLALEGKCFLFSSSYWEAYATEVWKFTRVQVGPGLRFYPEKALSGAFIGIYCDYLWMKVNYEDSRYNKSGTGLGRGYVAEGWIGYKWLLDNFVLEISTGYAYSRVKKISVTITDSSGNTSKDKYDSNFGVVGWTGIGLGIGVAF